MTDKVKAAIEKGLAVAKEYGENSWWEEYEIYKKEWKNYGKHRMYISFTGISNGRPQKTYKVGWVDMIDGTFVQTI